MLAATIRGEIPTFASLCALRGYRSEIRSPAIGGLFLWLFAPFRGQSAPIHFAAKKRRMRKKAERTDLLRGSTFVPLCLCGESSGDLLDCSFQGFSSPLFSHSVFSHSGLQSFLPAAQVLRPLNLFVRFRAFSWPPLR
jgi:hypothetical protein